MYEMTSRDFKNIEKFNGKLNSRYEYLEAIAEALGIDTVGVRHGARVMKGIALDEHTELDCKCRTTKGKMFIKEIFVTHQEYGKVNGETKMVDYRSDWFQFKRNKWYKNVMGEWNESTHGFNYTQVEM